MMMDGTEWSSFNGANSVNEEADFMAQLFPNCSLDSKNGNGNGALSSSCYSGMSGGDAYDFFPVDYCPNSVSKHYVQQFQMERNERSSGGRFEEQDNKSLQLKHECDQMSENDPVAEDLLESGRKRSRISEESSYKRGQHNEVHYHHHHHNAPSLPIDFLHCHMEDDENGVNVDLNDDLEPPPEDKSTANYKKRPRPSEVEKTGNKRNVRVKRSSSNLTLGGDDEEENNHRQSCSSGSLDEDFSSKATSTNTTTTARNSSGKTRASRGSATDPQSLYARKRRERINERLRILQGLVPNGTKVDISTMLEEAVHYVKFLQLQIKLLSSDEMWMYAPIAYNGMNIGLDFQFNLPR